MKKYLKILLTLCLTLLCSINKGVEAKNFLRIVDYPYSVYPLPGGLNQSYVINSNSPEIIKSEGILISTFPKDHTSFPDAHLDQAVQGDFDIFSHHIAVKAELTNIYQGIILNNPTKKTVTLNIYSSSTYITGPDAPFIKLPDYLRNDNGNTYAGPGDRVSQDVLRNKNYYQKKSVKIGPNEYFMLMNEQIPIVPLATINGKTTIFKLNSSGPLYVAEMAMFKRFSIYSTDIEKPVLDDWISLLNHSNVSEKRDHIPTPLNTSYQGIFYYSRVSGVVKGNKWDSQLINEKNYFKIPNKSTGVAYALNTVYNHTFGTNQVQSGHIIKRYKDTAYQSHANYGVTYEIKIPLYNLNKESTSVSISFDSPIRTVDDIRQDKVSYYEKPPEKITFRGDFKVEYENSLGNIVEKYIHLVQRSGQQGLPLVSIYMQPGDKRNVKISYIYPADCTPPHILTITSN